MVVVPTDHLLSAADAVTVADLDGEPILIPLDDVVGWAAAAGVRGRPPTRDGQGCNRTRCGGGGRARRSAVAGAAVSPQGPHVPPRHRRAYLPGGARRPNGAATGTGRGVHRSRAGSPTHLVARADRAGAETHRTGEDPREAGRQGRCGQGRPQAGPGEARSTLTQPEVCRLPNKSVEIRQRVAHPRRHERSPVRVARRLRPGSRAGCTARTRCASPPNSPPCGPRSGRLTSC